MATVKQSTQKQSKSESTEPKREWKGHKEIIVDEFRLENTVFQQNVQGLPNKPRWTPKMHKHFFKTYDSNGAPKQHSCWVGGHRHEITVKVVDGQFVAECGPPIYRRSGNKAEVLANDNHTHEVTYLGSDQFKQRKMTADAAKFLGAAEQAMNPAMPKE